MKTNQILAILLVYLAALSGMSSYLDARRIAEPQWSVMLTSLAGSVLVFWWYWKDSTLRSYRRTPLLNVAVVAFGFLAIPYYLLRSREKGMRLRALAKMLGFAGLMIGAVLVGGIPFALFS